MASDEQMPPDWAIERALGILGSLSSYESAAEVKAYAIEPTRNKHARVVAAFARYIAEHEEAPVDPLQECLRETYGAAAPEFVSAFRAALEKRGLEVREVRS